MSMDAFTGIGRRRTRLDAVHGRRCHNGGHLETAMRCTVDGRQRKVDTPNVSQCICIVY